MQTFTYTLTDPEGLHARPAGGLVKAAKQFPCSITVAKGGKGCDAKKMFGLMGLGIKHGDTITVTADGEQEQEAAKALETFLKANV